MQIAGSFTRCLQRRRRQGGRGPLYRRRRDDRRIRGDARKVVRRSRISTRRSSPSGKGRRSRSRSGRCAFLDPTPPRRPGSHASNRQPAMPRPVRDYTVLYVKQGGRWLYSSVREEYPDKPRTSRAAQGAGMDDRRVARRKLQLAHSRDLPAGRTTRTSCSAIL